MFLYQMVEDLAGSIKEITNVWKFFARTEENLSIARVHEVQQTNLRQAHAKANPSTNGLMSTDRVSQRH